MNTAIKVSSLTVAYEAKPVLWDVELELPRGQLVAVVGPNGAGKSTLIKAMLGLIPTVTGKVVFPEHHGVKPIIGYVPQSESVDWDFPITALDVVTMGCYGRLGWLKRVRKSDRQFAWEMLEKVGMGEFRNRQISRLSGGQQQRVFLARSLAQNADIYFMDEPFKGVDAATERSIIELLKTLRSSGKTVVVVHHDLATVPDYFDWVTLINLRVIACGEVADTFTENNLSRTFGTVRGAV